MLKIPPPPFSDPREHFRIAPPAHMIREFALWFRPYEKELHLPIEQLGQPDFCSINSEGCLHLENISAGGLCFSIPLDCLESTEPLKHKYGYIFLKLRRAMSGRHGSYNLFLGVRLIHAVAERKKIFFRGKISVRGRASRVDKSLQLFNVERVGIRELVVWCEELARMGRGILPPLSPGLDMEYLLLELAALEAPLPTPLPRQMLPRPSST